MKHPRDKKDCFRIHVIEEEYGKVKKKIGNSNVLLQVITKPADELIELGGTDALALVEE